jgi:hypothetical protein
MIHIFWNGVTRNKSLRLLCSYTTEALLTLTSQRRAYRRATTPQRSRLEQPKQNKNFLLKKRRKKEQKCAF